MPHESDAVRVKPRLRGVSHQIACAVAAIAGSMLVVSAPNRRTVIACSVYTAALVLLFGVSALYHRPTWDPRRRQWLRRLDHASIFVLIAGTYTPVCMLGLSAPAGERLMTIIWSGAIAGMLQALFWVHAPKPVTALIYLLLGWVLLPYAKETYHSLGLSTLLLILMGGAFYSIGAVIYALRRPDPYPQTFGYHEIFHALVVLAAICHFTAVYVIVHGRAS